MVSGDIQRAIEIINQRISSLEQIRKMLLEEFGMNSSKAETTLPTHMEAPPTKETRKAEIAKLLKAEGPLPRREIITRTGFPMGTVAYCLNDKERFARTRSGKWTVVSEGA